MGGEQKRNDPESWKNSGKGLNDVGDQTRDAWEQLKGDYEGMGDIFGENESDDVSSLIKMGYEAIHQAADEAFTSAADDYNAFGKAMQDVGQGHQDNQDKNQAQIAQLGSQMGVK